MTLQIMRTLFRDIDPIVLALKTQLAVLCRGMNKKLLPLLTMTTLIAAVACGVIYGWHHIFHAGTDTPRYVIPIIAGAELLALTTFFTVLLRKETPKKQKVWALTASLLVLVPTILIVLAVLVAYLLYTHSS